MVPARARCCWCGLLASSPGRGETVATTAIPSPIRSQATVIGTPSEFQADLPEDIPIQTREIHVLPGPRGAGDLLVHRKSALLALGAAGPGAACVRHARHRRQFRCEQEPDPAARPVSGRSARRLAALAAASELRRQRIGLVAARTAHADAQDLYRVDGADPGSGPGRDRDHRLRPGRLQPRRAPTRRSSPGWTTSGDPSTSTVCS